MLERIRRRFLLSYSTLLISLGLSEHSTACFRATEAVSRLVHAVPTLSQLCFSSTISTRLRPQIGPLKLRRDCRNLTEQRQHTVNRERADQNRYSD